MSDKEKAMVICGRLAEIHESAWNLTAEIILSKANSEEIGFFYAKLKKFR